MKMKNSILPFLLLFSSLLVAQEWTASGGYQYIYSSDWDKAIQRYNFGRPHLDEAQPLLIHGASLETAYFFGSNKKVNSGIKLEYGFTKSRAQNPEFDLSFHFHQLSLAYVLRYSFENKLERFYLEGESGILASLLSKRINQEVELIDDEANRVFGLGAEIGLTAFYSISLNERRTLSPYFGISYSPYLGSPDSESLLDPTISVNASNNVELMSWRIGLRISFLKK